jgi:hypothetical protein
VEDTTEQSHPGEFERVSWAVAKTLLNSFLLSYYMSSALLPRPQFELPRVTGKLILLLQKKLMKIVSWCFRGRTISFRSRKHFRALPRTWVSLPRTQLSFISTKLSFLEVSDAAQLAMRQRAASETSATKHRKYFSHEGLTWKLISLAT